MNIATDEQGTLQYMALQGKLDGSTASDFEKTCEHFLHMGARMFLLDARELDYISSSGVGVLIKWARTLERAGGVCAVSGAGSEVKWLLDFVGLSRSYPVFSSEEDARRYLTERHSRATRLSILTTRGPMPESEMRPRAIPVEIRSSSAPADSQTVTANSQTASVHSAQMATPSRESAELPAHLETLQKSLERVIHSLERIPDSIREIREQQISIGHAKAETVRFEDGIVVDCQRCHSHLRIKKSGEHLCPKCGARFLAARDGKVQFSFKNPWPQQQETLSASHS